MLHGTSVHFSFTQICKASVQVVSLLLQYYPFNMGVTATSWKRAEMQHIRLYISPPTRSTYENV